MLGSVIALRDLPTMSQDPRASRLIADLGRARTRLGRERLGRFAIEGTRLHERALRAGASVEAALVGRRFAASGEPRVATLLEALERSSCELHVVDDALLEELCEGRDLGAIAGLVRLPPARRLGDVLPEENRRQIVLAAVNVEEPGNVGALARTALAAGAVAFAAAGISDPFHPKSVRTSMGAVMRLPMLTYSDAAALHDDLVRENVQVVATASRGGVDPRAVRFDPHRVALLVGSEPFGLDRSVSDAADLVVSIPMSSDVDSFSVNAAAAILLHEISRAG